MGAFVDVDDDQVADVQVQSKEGIGYLAFVSHSKSVQSLPDDHGFRVVAFVAFEPGVEGRGGLSVSDAGHAHGEGCDEVSAFADGMGRDTEPLPAPLGVALIVEGIFSGGCYEEQRGEHKDLHMEINDIIIIEQL